VNCNKIGPEIYLVVGFVIAHVERKGCIAGVSFCCHLFSIYGIESKSTSQAFMNKKTVSGNGYIDTT